MIHRVCGLDDSCGIGGTASSTAHTVCARSCGVGGTASSTAHTLCAHNVHTDDMCTHTQRIYTRDACKNATPGISAQWRGANKDALKVCGSTFFFSFLFCYDVVVHRFTRSSVKCS